MVSRIWEADMYRQQAERLAGKLGINRPDLSVDVYQDGIRSASWLVRIEALTVEICRRQLVGPGAIRSVSEAVRYSWQSARSA